MASGRETGREDGRKDGLGERKVARITRRMVKLWELARSTRVIAGAGGICGGMQR
jgi:hypothetical protein